MKFLEIINKKKFTLISIFLFLYVLLNLLDGERGLISYYEKQKIIKKFSDDKKLLEQQLRIWLNLDMSRLKINRIHFQKV